MDNNIPESDADQTPDDEQLGSMGPRASWPWSLDIMQQSLATYPPDAKQLLIAAFLWCTDSLHPMSRAEFATQVGSNENTIYKFFTGTMRYPKDVIKRGKAGEEIGREPHPKAGQIIYPKAELLKAIAQFLALEKKRFSLGETDLVITPTLKSIETVCNAARESKKMAMIVGPSHIGKTWATEGHYVPQNNHGRTLYTRMETASGLGGMVRAMAESISISPKGNTKDLIRRIKNGVTSNMLWIIDEAHLLQESYRKSSFAACVNVLREIHDKKKIAIVLIFTYADLHEMKTNKELKQVWRRMVHRLILPEMPTIADLTAILKHSGLEFPDTDLSVPVRYKDDAGAVRSMEDKPRAILRQLAKEEGLLAITERIRYARALAKKAAKQLNWAHWIEAHFRIAKQSDPATDWV